MKKGLLIAPGFPNDSFWSYGHVMKYIGKKAPFPPAGLLTFAAMMPSEWDFEIIDANVKKPTKRKLRKKIQEADAVFVGAMNIQRPSLVELIEATSGEHDTPWVLGGPMASTYKDTILEPQTEEEEILHEGLDHLVWGEAQPWIESLTATLEENPTHSSSTPKLFIPDRVLSEPPGSRKYLLDKSIFKPLDTVPTPRWDLIDPNDYHAMMIQTTAGCRFRCDFCDIVQFNGGFARAKDKEAVRRELKAIYDTDFKGSVFTVDDNFVSSPEAMETILEGMTEFQREYDYPFRFLTQASVDLGNEKLSYLIPLMKQAGFGKVFLGIENPNPKALKKMNKVQNVKTDIGYTIDSLKKNGIEVFAGFIYGTDTDTRQTADEIVRFVKQNDIFTAMTGHLSPMPGTPLHQRLKEEERLIEEVVATNNVDETLEFQPIMPVEDFHAGYSHILSSLFNKKAIYERAENLLENLDLHIFSNPSLGKTRKSAGLRSLIKQGLLRMDGDYFRLLRNAYNRDMDVSSQAETEGKVLTHFWDKLSLSGSNQVELDENATTYFKLMLHYAQDGLIRYAPEIKLPEVRDLVDRMGESIKTGVVSLEDAKTMYDNALVYLRAKVDMHKKIGGAYLVRAFELAIKGKHYETVVGNIQARTN